MRPDAGSARPGIPEPQSESVMPTASDSLKPAAPPFRLAQRLSDDRRLNQLLQSVVDEVKRYAEDQIEHLYQSARIGSALSAEKNIDRLLEMIVDEARALTNADGGTLYTVDTDRRYLRFKILQNDTLNVRMGGTSGVAITLPDVPLLKAGKPNYSNVSSYVALTEKTVAISDVYEAEGFDFTGTRNYDRTTGYRSRSMLVIPLKNHENEIIGVLQLLNAKERDDGTVTPFSPETVDLVASLASQAAVAMTNTKLIQDLKDLLDAFIRSIATAIDEKSPYTGGHINRVVDLTLMIARQIDAARDGPFRDASFNPDEIEELRLATWMHDVGKITTPEYVVDKASKLQTIFDRIQLIDTRFHLIGALQENTRLARELQALRGVEQSTPPAFRLPVDLQNDLEFLHACNGSDAFMDDARIARVKAIGARHYTLKGQSHPYLTAHEIECLAIRRGTLTDAERKIVENHATMTLKILRQLPFPRRLANVPDYAGGHHEKLDGSGYPQGLKGQELPLQARIIAIADVFEALTARDRPYKEPMKLSRAIQILDGMKQDNHIDPDICDLFIQSGLFRQYAVRELHPDQIDV